MFVHCVAEITCADGFGGCEHQCEDTDTGPVCQCNTGYELAANEQSCAGEFYVNSLLSFCLCIFSIFKTLVYSKTN